MQNHFIQHLPVRNHCRKGMYSTQGVQKNALTKGPKSPQISYVKNNTYLPKQSLK